MFARIAGIILSTIMLLLMVFIFSGADSPSPNLALAQHAYKILKDNCYECHGRNGVANKNIFVLDHARLISARTVIPGDKNSLLLQMVESGDMPEDEEMLPDEEISILQNWVLSGAPDWSADEQTVSRTFITETEIVKLIEQDLLKQDEPYRQYYRYFSIAHLYNAGVPETELEEYRLGLSKLLNILSWNRMTSIPVPIDPENTLLRIDLRDIKWTSMTWKTILASYPYGVKTQESQRITELSGTDLPYIRADWFVTNASVPPLYHDILSLPEKMQELETKLSLDSCTEPIYTLSQKFIADLTLAQAASEVGMQPKEFQDRISQSSRLKELGFSQFLLTNGSFKRTAWEEYYGDLTRELNLGYYITPQPLK